jgi:hypothetical protein
LRVGGGRTFEASRRFERQEAWLEEGERAEVEPLVQVGRRCPHAKTRTHLVCGLGLRVCVWGLGRCSCWIKAKVCVCERESDERERHEETERPSERTRERE